MPEVPVPQTCEDQCGFLYFCDQWGPGRCNSTRYDGAWIECAACGCRFMVTHEVDTLSAKRFSNAILKSVRERLRERQVFNLNRVRIAVCRRCGERLR